MTKSLRFETSNYIIHIILYYTYFAIITLKSLRSFINYTCIKDFDKSIKARIIYYFNTVLFEHGSRVKSGDRETEFKYDSVNGE